MCFFVPWLCTFVDNVIELRNWLVFAAVLPLLWPICGWFKSRPASMAVAAVLMFLAITQHWLSGDKSLKAQLEAKTAQLEIARSTTAALQKSFMDEALVNEHNTGVLANLRKRINAMGDKPECGVSKDFTDALKDLR